MGTKIDLSETQKVTKVDVQNNLDGLAVSKQARTMGAIRLMVDAAMKPSTEMSVDGIAKSSGLPHFMVKQLMLSPEYSEVVARACRSYLPTMQMKLLAAIDGKIGASPEDGGFTNSQLIQAGRLINESIRTHQAQQDLRDTIDVDQSMSALEKECEDMSTQVRQALAIPHTVIT